MKDNPRVLEVHRALWYGLRCNDWSVGNMGEGMSVDPGDTLCREARARLGVPPLTEEQKPVAAHGLLVQVCKACPVLATLLAERGFTVANVPSYDIANS